MIFIFIVLALTAYFAYRYYRWNFAAPSEFYGKTVLITGASSGIGEELAK